MGGGGAEMKGVAPAVRELEEELRAWRAACAAAMEAGEGGDGARLPEEIAVVYNGAAAIIHAEGLTRGEPVWLPEGDYRPAAAGKARAKRKRAAVGADLVNDWPSYAAARGMPVDNPAVTALITNVLTFPMTIYHALHEAVALGAVAEGILSQRTLTVHVLGAEYDTEVDGAEKWAELLQMLPGVRELKLLLVGPELPKEVHGERISVSVDGAASGESKKGKRGGAGAGKAPRTAVVEFQQRLYHDLPRKSVPPPDLAVAFNSGLADLRGDWAPTVTRLCKDNVLCCFTSYHPQEAGFDARTLTRGLDARVLAGPAPNPFPSTFPNPDPIFGDRAYYVNAFYTLFKGVAKGDDNAAAEAMRAEVDARARKLARIAAAEAGEGDEDVDDEEEEGEGSDRKQLPGTSEDARGAAAAAAAPPPKRRKVVKRVVVRKRAKPAVK